MLQLSKALLLTKSPLTLNKAGNVWGFSRLSNMMRVQQSSLRSTNKNIRTLSFAVPFSRNYSSFLCPSTFSRNYTTCLCSSRLSSLSLFPAISKSRRLPLFFPRHFFHSSTLRSSSTIKSRIAESEKKRIERITVNILLSMSLWILVLGFTFAFVPLYKMVCQQTGLDGSPKASLETDMTKISTVENRPIQIRFEADTANNMRWEFLPQQRTIDIVPGETALAFYRARNKADHAITGISTYNVLPFSAAQYFNKIQCFCFEEQRLAPNEEVDMPVFFYIDPEFALDPELADTVEVCLSYTFFESNNFNYEEWQNSLPESLSVAPVPLKKA